MDPEEARKALEMAIGELVASNTAALRCSGPVSINGFDLVVRKALPATAKNLLVLLETTGGNPDAAYRIARFLRRSYEKVTVYVPSVCKSAGTLIRIGDRELGVSRTSELGPLDVQVRRQNELFAFRSGPAMPEALDFLESRMLRALRSVLVDFTSHGGLGTERASRIAVNAAVGVFAPIYARIDPAGLGGTARALAVAQDYAARLPGNLREGALERLVTGYSSHSFVIDPEEIKDLFKVVRPPTESEAMIAKFLGLGSTESAIRGSGHPEVMYANAGNCKEADYAESNSEQGTDSKDPGGAVGSVEGNLPSDVPANTDADEEQETPD